MTHTPTRTPPPPQCSIALWRGYVTAQFYARPQNSDGALALSPAFRTWRFPWQERVPLNEDPAALAALEGLTIYLESRDWEHLGRAPGSDWYEYRFRLTRRRRERGAA